VAVRDVLLAGVTEAIAMESEKSSFFELVTKLQVAEDITALEVKEDVSYKCIILQKKLHESSTAVADI